MTPEEAFLILIKKLIPNAVTIEVGTVKSVDKEKRTCDIERDGKPDLFNCRLNAVIDTLESHITCYPAIGSFVLCVTLDEPTACYVFATSLIEETEVRIGDISAVINAKDIVFNEGTLGGLPVVGDVTKRLNLIEKAVNSLINEFRSHNHTHPQGATTGLLTPPVTNTIAETKVPDIENNLVKQ